MGRDAAEAKRLKKLDELKKKNDAKNKGKAKKTAMKMDRESVEKRRMTKLEQQRVLRNKKGVKGRGDGTTMGGPNMYNALEKQALKLKKNDDAMFNDVVKKGKAIGIIVTKKNGKIVLKETPGVNMGGMMKKKSMGYMYGGSAMKKSKTGYNKGGLKGGQSKLDKNKDGKISGADFKMMNKGGMSKKGKSGYMYGGMTKSKKK